MTSISVRPPNGSEGEYRVVISTQKNICPNTFLNASIREKKGALRGIGYERSAPHLRERDYLKDSEVMPLKLAAGTMVPSFTRG